MKYIYCYSALVSHGTMQAPNSKYKCQTEMVTEDIVTHLIQQKFNISFDL